MDGSKLTQKSLQAVRDCQNYAEEYGNQEISEEHLLYALLNQEDSLILKLVERMEINKEYFTNRVLSEIEKKPKVSGADCYVGENLRKCFSAAEKIAKQMGDEYISVEHLMLAMIDNPSVEMKGILKEFGITRCAEISGLPETIPREPTMCLPNTDRILYREQRIRNSIRSSAVTAKSET